MASTGTVSDFDRAGLFGLIVTDDGHLLPFNLHETPPTQRRRLGIGTRVRFTQHAAEPTARAVDVAPIEESHRGKFSGASGSNA